MCLSDLRISSAQEILQSANKPQRSVDVKTMGLAVCKTETTSQNQRCCMYFFINCLTFNKTEE